MYTVFKEKSWFGIEKDYGTVVLFPMFDTREEAQKYADAYNKGARSYSEADAMIYGLADMPETQGE